MLQCVTCILQLVCNVVISCKLQVAREIAPWSRMGKCFAYCILFVTASYYLGSPLLGLPFYLSTCLSDYCWCNGVNKGEGHPHIAFSVCCFQMEYILRAKRSELTSKLMLSGSDGLSNDLRKMDPETQARLETLLEAAGIPLQPISLLCVDVVG